VREQANAQKMRIKRGPKGMPRRLEASSGLRPSRQQCPPPQEDRQIRNAFDALQIEDEADSSSAQAASPSAAASSDSDVDMKRFRRSIKNNVEEYFELEDIKEFCECMKELKNDELAYKELVSYIAKTVGTSKVKQQVMLFKLVERLIDDKCITGKTFCHGLVEAIETRSDIAVDAPRAPGLIAELVAIGASKDCVKPAFLDAPHVVETENPHVFVAMVLGHLLKRTDEATVKEFAEGLKHSLQSLVPEDRADELPSLLEKHRLKFLAGDDTTEKDVAAVLAATPTADAVQKWVKDNAASRTSDPAFVRGMVLAIVKYCAKNSTCPNENHQSTKEEEKKEEALLKSFLALFKMFAALQLHLMYSLQEAAHDLGFPLGFLPRMVALFYDEDVLSEGTIVEWTTDASLASQYQGKEVAMHQIKPLLEDLASAPEARDSEA
jgi:hypothetical protein